MTSSASWRHVAREAAVLALESIRVHTARSILAMVGLVIGIVTVVLVASTLVGLRNSVAQLFRELGTENIFAFHRGGDPYSPASDADANRKTLTSATADAITRLAPSVRDVGVQLLIPAATSTRVITARAGGKPPPCRLYLLLDAVTIAQRSQRTASGMSPTGEKGPAPLRHT